MNQSTLNAYLIGIQIVQWAILLHLICSAITAVHCVTKNNVREKTAWVIVILATPHIGWIAYWFNRQKPSYSLPEANPSYTPPPQTAEGIAAAIAADLAKQPKERHS
jgi:hypothetical protein